MLTKEFKWFTQRNKRKSKVEYTFTHSLTRDKQEIELTLPVPLLIISRVQLRRSLEFQVPKVHM